MRGWAVWAALLTVVLLYNPGAQPSVRFSRPGPRVFIPDVIMCTITPICVLIAPAEMEAAGQKAMVVASLALLGWTLRLRARAVAGPCPAPASGDRLEERPSITEVTDPCQGG